MTDWIFCIIFVFYVYRFYFIFYFPLTRALYFSNGKCVSYGAVCSEKAVGRRGKGDVFLFSKLCDIIILRFPGAKSNGADTTFSGRSSGLRRIRVFSFLIYLLKSFLKALNRYGVFFYTYTYIFVLL